jgi:hypothetical protein
VSHIYLGGGSLCSSLSRYLANTMNITIVLARYLDKEEHKLPPPR